MEGEPRSDFLARMSEVFVQRILMVKRFKSIFSDFDILVKNVASVATDASRFGFFL